MTEGIHIDINELIALKRYAPSVSYPPEDRALRQGNHTSILRGRGMDFAEVRNYQAGDEIRHMEWRVTARTGRPHVKIYQEERERPVFLLVDFSPSMYFGTRVSFKSVVAAKLAAIIAWTASKQGDRVGGVVFSNKTHVELMPRGREAGVLQLISSLSKLTKQKITQYQLNPGSFANALLRLRRIVRPGSMIVLISDFYALNAECSRHLKHLKQHNNILAYQIADPLELLAPPPNQYAVTNGEEEAVLDLSGSDTAELYNQYWKKRNKEIAQIFKKNQIQYVALEAKTDLSLLVRQTYPRRKNG